MLIKPLPNLWPRARASGRRCPRCGRPIPRVPRSRLPRTRWPIAPWLRLAGETVLADATGERILDAQGVLKLAKDGPCPRCCTCVSCPSSADLTFTGVAPCLAGCVGFDQQSAGNFSGTFTLTQTSPSFGADCVFVLTTGYSAVKIEEYYEGGDDCTTLECYTSQIRLALSRDAATKVWSVGGWLESVDATCALVNCSSPMGIQANLFQGTFSVPGDPICGFTKSGVSNQLAAFDCPGQYATSQCDSYFLPIVGYHGGSASITLPNS